jgi:hypothetical protein
LRLVALIKFFRIKTPDSLQPQRGFVEFPAFIVKRPAFLVRFELKKVRLQSPQHLAEQQFERADLGFVQPFIARAPLANPPPNRGG